MSAPTYADPHVGLTYTLKHWQTGNTYDPPNGADGWLCPLCPRELCNRAYDGFRGTYQALRGHLGDKHNVIITEQTITITLGRTFADAGGIVRYVDDRDEEEDRDA